MSEMTSMRLLAMYDMNSTKRLLMRLLAMSDKKSKRVVEVVVPWPRA